MVESLDSDYVRTGQSQGRKAKRVSGSPTPSSLGSCRVLTIAAGLVGWTLAGSVLVEGHLRLARYRASSR
jgi:peptide/nickel transport system permease protein